MKRNIIVSALIAVLLIGLTACNGSQNQESQPSSEGKAKANTEKMDSAMEAQSMAFPGATKQVAESYGKKVTWWIFKDADWSKDFKGLKMKIEQVALTEEVPNIELGHPTPAIRVKFSAHNTSSKYEFEIHPSHAILHTSTGKDLKAAMYISDELKKKIDYGKTKEALVGYYLIESPKVDQIESVSFDFIAKKTQPKEKGEKEKAFNTGEIKLR
ncbi:MAG TPA: hypothetical protein VF199_05725 [Bacillales bacterium]